jgi:hypothetical protein
VTREATKICGGAKVLVARGPGGRGGTPITGPGDYGSWEEAPYLVPLIIEERLAPAWHRAKILLNMTKVEGAPRPVWLWRQEVSVDDRIQIVTREGGKRLFTGFAVDVDLAATGNDETCMITAVSGAYRLARDQVVYGRWMYSRAPGYQAAFYSGLRTVFNPGGIPNRHPLKCTSLPHAPTDGVPLFAFDGDPAAEWWTLGDVLDYLRWIYNADETWIENGPAPQGVHGDAYDEAFRLSLDATGLSVWAALAAACDLAAWDLYEDAEAGQTDRGVIAAVQRGFGDAAFARRQGPDLDGERPALDFRDTNVFVAALAETTTGAVTRPIVAGGQDLYQITIPLQPAWDPARMELEEGEVPSEPDEASQYADRYLRSGSDFPSYADVGRLWDANTDGRYSVEPWGLAVPDVAGLAGQAADSWPEMPYRPAPMLTTVSPEVLDPETGERLATPPTQERIVEYSCDAGTTWHVLADYSVAADRLAVMLTHENLGEIGSGLTEEGDPEDLFTALWEDRENATDCVRMRLTCTIEAPTRAIYSPPLRPAAGTGFETAEFFDRGQYGQNRTVAASSLWADGEAWSDAVDGWDELEAHGLAIQAASDRRRIEGNLAWEWLESAPELTAVVDKIVGVDYELAEGADADGQPAYPRVVARTLDLRNWSVVLALGSERKAGTRFRPSWRVRSPGQPDVWSPGAGARGRAP